ncbi:hypothetical protein [Amycolatopsis sp. H20-H5]|uniref:hypothetical protein n=1 Tax=Amycolatopsis sp. H20-H5 TaxID=3046309 RepID=UPI002DBE2FA6|nr:hypothetical protein [Amycolatopsis sp. H20-H5]MEC3980869.1 hypothetical protein [Amycolatopsis sp. H20-H5]
MVEVVLRVDRRRAGSEQRVQSAGEVLQTIEGLRRAFGAGTVVSPGDGPGLIAIAVAAVLIGSGWWARRVIRSAAAWVNAVLEEELLAVQPGFQWTAECDWNSSNCRGCHDSGDRNCVLPAKAEQVVFRR